MLSAIAGSAWAMLLESAPWMLLGVLVAGLVREFLPQELVGRHLGGRSLGAVLRAAALGVPLPL